MEIIYLRLQVSASRPPVPPLEPKSDHGPPLDRTEWATPSHQVSRQVFLIFMYPLRHSGLSEKDVDIL
jgi:hypothetical protein